MRRTLAILALLAFPSFAAAQRDSDNLRVSFRTILLEWAQGDASGVARHLAPAGVVIDVSDGPMGPLADRQAIALLRQVFAQGETTAVDVNMLERVGGQPPRGFGSITWTTRPAGTQVPVRRTVYFGLQLIRGAWRVSEIRLIP